jgi:hypothetical protein
VLQAPLLPQRLLLQVQHLLQHLLPLLQLLQLRLLPQQLLLQDM